MGSNKTSTTYFYKDKPIFGLDIGFSSVKVMQLEAGKSNQPRRINGYGVVSFNPNTLKDGVISDYEAMAAAIKELFEKHVIGEITTRRVALAVPAVRTFNRPMTLPKLADKELTEAVRLEAEQYIPVPLNELYMDYTVSRQTDKETQLLAVAVPKKIIDSYQNLMHVLGLEAVAMETTISAASRLFMQAEQSDVPTVLIDFGSISADITVFDKDLVVTGTVPCGGDLFTDMIAATLKVSKQEAHVIKTKYGLGPSKKQPEITSALKPVLDELLKEVRRVIRYYDERSGTNTTINQIVTMGGGANMPGLSEFMTNSLRLAVRMCDPWQHLDFAGLQPPHSVEKSMYVTVAGLALINPREIFV